MALFLHLTLPPSLPPSSQVEEFDRLKDMEDKLQAVERELQWALVIEIEKVGLWEAAGRDADTLQLGWCVCEGVCVSPLPLAFQAVPPIESDIERAKERIPRNKQRAQAAEVAMNARTRANACAPHFSRSCAPL